jgi:hypothetical protein
MGYGDCAFSYCSAVIAALYFALLVMVAHTLWRLMAQDKRMAQKIFLLFVIAQCTGERTARHGGRADASRTHAHTHPLTHSPLSHACATRAVRAVYFVLYPLVADHCVPSVSDDDDPLLNTLGTVPVAFFLAAFTTLVFTLCAPRRACA